MADDKFVFDSLQDTETIREYLDSLVQGFESGRILLTTDTKELELNPSGLLSFTVKARKKGVQNKLSIKVTWKEETATEPRTTKKLSIGS